MIALLLATVASANPHNALSFLVGTSTAFDDDPASLRLSVRGDVGIAHNDIAGISVLVPVTVSTWGEDAIGFSNSDVLVEVPVGVRGTLLPHGSIRPYADAGLGLAIGSSSFDTWFLNTTSSSTAFMTRVALGLEVGKPEGVSLVVEPASLRTFFANDSRARSSFGLMLGLAAPI